MRKPVNRSSNPSNRPCWRDYQLQQRQPSGRRSLAPIIVILLIVAAITGVSLFFSEGTGFIPAQTAQASLPSVDAVPTLVNKRDLQQLFDHQALKMTNLKVKGVELPFDQQMLQVKTSLDEDLQNYLLDNMDRKNSRYIGIVVMEADTGRVLALAGFDKIDPEGNPCLRGEFPAASIFKIVTAAAALDAYGYTADSNMHFNGQKYTLYKRQLQDQTDKHTSTVTFEDAFAQSINPVFGKIGTLQLGKPLLEKSAAAFGFNTPLDFELPLSLSHFEIGDQPYNWAEIASGFNRETTLSPLHGAMMATAVLNEGFMVTPSLVDEVVDAQGKALYTSQLPAKHLAMSPKAAHELSRMMEATIASGTSRKAFRGYSHDKILSGLEIGGKTGSINNRSQDAKIDWFVGFAKEREGQAKLAVAVMVAHEKLIGTRASQYARMAMARYFGSQAAEAARLLAEKSS
jgi:penicillin-binding protein A